MMLRNYILFAFTICIFNFGLLEARQEIDTTSVADIVESTKPDSASESDADAAYREKLCRKH